MRLATIADAAEITACLRTAPHLAMFPLGYLHRDGFAGRGERTMEFWVNLGQITDVLSISSVGMVLPFLPNTPYAGAIRAIGRRPVSGIIGPADQTRALQRLLGLEDAPSTLDHDEPHFTLDLKDLRVPDGLGTLVALADAPRDVVLNWMMQYQTDTLKAPLALAWDRAEASYENALKQDNRRVLMDGPQPLAMTAFNAQLPDIVQIGGVFTPPDLRGKGYARRVVALHLAQARARGVTRATLAAANEAAQAAYEAIGFQKIGQWAFVLFEGRQVPHV